MTRNFLPLMKSFEISSICLQQNNLVSQSQGSVNGGSSGCIEPLNFKHQYSAAVIQNPNGAGVNYLIIKKKNLFLKL